MRPDLKGECGPCAGRPAVVSPRTGNEEDPSGASEPGMSKCARREMELLFLEFEGVWKESQGKSTSLP